jgi:FtsZ-interacting cell division protein YlmF
MSIVVWSHLGACLAEPTDEQHDGQPEDKQQQKQQAEQEEQEEQEDKTRAQRVQKQNPSEKPTIQSVILQGLNLGTSLQEHWLLWLRQVASIEM